MRDCVDLKHLQGKGLKVTMFGISKLRRSLLRLEKLAAARGRSVD
jgi:hypothetical protein